MELRDPPNLWQGYFLTGPKATQGVRIQFFPARKGDAKKWLLLNGPTAAAQILANDPEAHVAISPDLYPRNKAFPHETQVELELALQERLRAELHRMHCDDARVLSRFRAFCFKYEFEVLALACEDLLSAHLHCEEFKVRWRRPVEDQDHERPPKAVLKELFREHGAYYANILTAVDRIRLSATVRSLPREPWTAGQLAAVHRRMKTQCPRVTVDSATAHADRQLIEYKRIRSR
ncbi:MAG: hypothetical protein ABSF98_25600 [Bryobacteraceae bacterium]|jgi:hypothetical protein